MLASPEQPASADSKATSSNDFRNGMNRTPQCESKVPDRVAAVDGAQRAPDTEIWIGVSAVVSAIDRVTEEANAAVGHAAQHAGGMVARDGEDAGPIAGIIGTFIAGGTIGRKDRRKGAPVRVSKAEQAARRPRRDGSCDVLSIDGCRQAGGRVAGQRSRGKTEYRLAKNRRRLGSAA